MFETLNKICKKFEGPHSRFIQPMLRKIIMIKVNTFVGNVF